MNICICNERFLFRFGLDRVLILMAKGLADRGHQVTLLGTRADKAIVDTIAHRFVQVPEAPDDYARSDSFTAEWLAANFAKIFPPGEEPDAVVIGGWPFFEAIDLFAARTGAVAFLDPGAVPLDGMSGGALFIQEKLRTLRRQHLPNATAILPISDFISRTQSISDRGTPEGITTIRLGADHMEMNLWQSEHVSGSGRGETLAAVERLKAGGRRVILNLGRWETGNYKNSAACLQIMREVRRTVPDAVLLVLSPPGSIDLPPDLAGAIHCIGFPDDAELQAIMAASDLGISVSLWEGFNLPLAEMQWQGQPAVAFDIGAHPEVIAHPWFLCRDEADMVARITDVLSGATPAEAASSANLDRWRQDFRWSNVLDRYCRFLEDLGKRLPADPVVPPLLIVDVTNSCRDTANSGVIRVTRRLCHSLQDWLDPVFVVWNEELRTYTLPSVAGYELLSQYNGPRMPDQAIPYLNRATPVTLNEFLERLPGNGGVDPVFFLPETVLGDRVDGIQQFIRSRGWKSVAILYDLIPLLYPEFCSHNVRTPFKAYLGLVASCDVIIPISQFSADSFTEHCRLHGMRHGTVSAVQLPGEFGGHPRGAAPPANTAGPVRILCVSTLEKRKNHRNLLKAVRIMAERHPEIDWELTLVGNLYAEEHEIADAVRDATARDARIRWLGVVDDATLSRLYDQSSFTIYPSIVEGFGMPVLESIWHCRPCLCNETGVMAELAAEGGCLTVDVEDPDAFADAIARLCQDQSLRERLTREAVSRPVKNWDDYAREFLGSLSPPRGTQGAVLTVGFGSAPGHAAPVPANEAPAPSKVGPMSFQDMLYPSCLMDNWQMHDSERMALTGLLARHKPACSLEIGTYFGGSLSLIAQYSKVVFSVDIDAAVLDRVPDYDNVSFLIGPSTEVVPRLFRALEDEGIDVDFILIDADHSAEGVRRDIEIVLKYVPRKPLLIAMHDSFNPDCRAGIVSADWESSPYAHWVDVDFVPGRIVEGEGNAAAGQMWGGLAVAMLQPTPRQGRVDVHQTARQFFEKSRAASFHTT
ncbi:glycosyltransferase [Skermanella pratensis]|uniref:glycosyltransferase n=1 Tax=Skermanella pratensis TaxID=2233999 RepID=UPI001301012D|nr:glycosyltransferase [Skermanella pratensis]